MFFVQSVTMKEGSPLIGKVHRLPVNVQSCLPYVDSTSTALSSWCSSNMWDSTITALQPNWSVLQQWLSFAHISLNRKATAASDWENQVHMRWFWLGLPTATPVGQTSPHAISQPSTSYNFYFEFYIQIFFFTRIGASLLFTLAVCHSTLTICVRSLFLGA